MCGLKPPRKQFIQLYLTTFYVPGIRLNKLTQFMIKYSHYNLPKHPKKNDSRSKNCTSFEFLSLFIVFAVAFFRLYTYF